MEAQSQNEAVVTVASQEAELTDGALGQQANHYPAAQLKAQEQQQKLQPAEGTAGQEDTAGAPENMTKENVPVSSTPSQPTTGLVQAAESPSLSSIFDSIDFVARFLSLHQPQDDESPTSSSPGLSSNGGRV